MSQNHALFILDGLRYDTYQSTETDFLPNKSHLAKAYSHAVWTVPSMMSYLLGYSPTRIEPWVFFEGDPGVDRVAQDMQERGYNTAFYSGSAWMSLHREMFEQGFDVYDAELDKNRLQEYVDKDFGNTYTSNKPFFQLFHVMETHHPSYDGKEETEFTTDAFHNYEAQQKALLYADKQIEKIVEDMPVGTTITVTADHGDAWGEGASFGHNPNGGNIEGFRLKSMPNTVTEIPFVQGEKREDGEMVWQRKTYMIQGED